MLPRETKYELINENGTTVGVAIITPDSYQKRAKKSGANNG
jgi:hypothetical protein